MIEPVIRLNEMVDRLELEKRRPQLAAVVALVLVGFLAVIGATPTVAVAGGWYLAVPPMIIDRGEVVQVFKEELVPPRFRGWYLEAFDSAKECKQELERREKEAKKRSQMIWDWKLKHPGDDAERRYKGAIAESMRQGRAECVASDDPRLLNAR